MEANNWHSKPITLLRVGNHHSPVKRYNSCLTIMELQRCPLTYLVHVQLHIECRDALVLFAVVLADAVDRVWHILQHQIEIHLDSRQVEMLGQWSGCTIGSHKRLQSCGKSSHQVLKEFTKPPLT
eukprot:4694606-Pyramimonas_sp.AAC.1